MRNTIEDMLAGGSPSTPEARGSVEATPADSEVIRRSIVRAYVHRDGVREVYAFEARPDAGIFYLRRVVVDEAQVLKEGGSSVLEDTYLSVCQSRCMDLTDESPEVVLLVVEVQPLKAFVGKVPGEVTADAGLWKPLLEQVAIDPISLASLMDAGLQYGIEKWASWQKAFLLTKRVGGAS